MMPYMHQDVKCKTPVAGGDRTPAIPGRPIDPEMSAHKNRACMTKAADAYVHIAKDFPLEAQYVLPLAYRMRVLFTWNFRELFHFIPLQSPITIDRRGSNAPP